MGALDANSSRCLPHPDFPEDEQIHAWGNTGARIRAYGPLALSSSAEMAPGSAGGGLPPLSPFLPLPKIYIHGLMRRCWRAARWEHTRKGTNAYLAESSVPAREGRQLRQFVDERVVSLSYMWEVGQWR